VDRALQREEDEREAAAERETQWTNFWATIKSGIIVGVVVGAVLDVPWVRIGAWLVAAFRKVTAP